MIEGSLDENFMIIGRANNFCNSLAIAFERSDQGNDDYKTIANEKFGYFGSPTDVFHTIFVREAKTLVNSEAQVIAVQNDGMNVTLA